MSSKSAQVNDLSEPPVLSDPSPQAAGSKSSKPAQGKSSKSEKLSREDKSGSKSSNTSTDLSRPSNSSAEGKPAPGSNVRSGTNTGSVSGTSEAGHSKEKVAKTQPRISKKKESGSKKKIYIGVGVAVAIVLIACIAVGIWAGTRDTKTAPASTTTTVKKPEVYELQSSVFPYLTPEKIEKHGTDCHSLQTPLCGKNLTGTMVPWVVDGETCPKLKDVFDDSCKRQCKPDTDQCLCKLPFSAKGIYCVDCNVQEIEKGKEANYQGKCNFAAFLSQIWETIAKNTEEKSLDIKTTDSKKATNDLNMVVELPVTESEDSHKLNFRFTYPQDTKCTLTLYLKVNFAKSSITLEKNRNIDCKKLSDPDQQNDLRTDTYAKLKERFNAIPKALNLTFS